MPDNFKLDLPHRPRRLRRTASLRALTEETVLRPTNFIALLFVVEGARASWSPLEFMPGASRLSISADLVKECRELLQAGRAGSGAVFPSSTPNSADDEGTAALHRGWVDSARRQRGEEGCA